MNNGYARILVLACLFLSFCFTANSQIELKLQLMPDGDSWGIYARPHPSINPSATTITASGQVTVVMPANFQWINLIPVKGNWVSNAAVTSPPENPGAKYVSFGLVDDDPHIDYIVGQETLLFTFEKLSACPEFLYLIDCGTPNEQDEFCFPNSLNTNPGNDMSVFDFDSGNASLYFFTDNYNHYAWSCHDADGDGIVDAHEDTNGNGVFDPGEDESDLFDPNDPGSDAGIRMSLQLMPDGQSWGIYAKPAGGLSPSNNTVTHDGKTEIVAPLGFEIDSITSQSGSWVHDSTVDGPLENQSRTYLSFSMVSEDPSIQYSENTATLLFTIHRAGSCPDSLNIIDEMTDPVALGCTPSQGNLCIFNSLNITDYGVTPNVDYSYVGSYSNSAWSCHDNDGDGVVNAFEDTNGDGGFDGNNDDSDLNDPCDPYHPLSATLTYDGVSVLCDGDVIEGEIMVEIESPRNSSYSVQYTDGTEVFTVNNYQSGDEISISTFGGAVFEIIAVTDEFACPVTGDLTGVFEIEKDGPVTFSSQPDDVTACAGTSTYMKALAENAGAGAIDYQWQISCDNGDTWTDVADGGPAEINGAETATLYINNLENDISGCQFRLQAKTASCDPTYSSPGLLVAEGPISIETQPSNVGVCAGDQACFSLGAANAGAGDIQYQWQVQQVGSVNWTNLNNNAFVSGATSSVLCFNETTNMQDIYVRAVIKTAACNQMTSFTTQLQIDGPLVVSGVPVDQTVYQDDDVIFTASVENTSGGAVALQWQQSADGVNWTNVLNGDNGTNAISGANTTTLSISPAYGLDGRQFRLVGSSAICGDIISPSANLEVSGQVITITGQPQDQTVCSGGFAYFSINAQNAGTTPTAYQWQYSSNGTDWDDVPENTDFIGTTTANLFVSDATGINGYKFRCLVSTGVADPVTSAPASLEVLGPFGIDTQAEDADICFNEGHEFSVEIENPSDLDYEVYWQMSDDNGISWEAIDDDSDTGFGGVYEGTETENLNITSVEGLDSYQFRLVVEAGACSTISDPTTLTVVDDPTCHPATDYVDYKLKLRPDGQSWGVWIKAKGDYVPSGYNKATSGRIVIAATAGFAYYNVKSHAGGTWTPGTYKLDAPETPGISYYTFDLTPNNNNINLTEGGQVMLFSFSKLGACPDDIYLAHEFVPAGLLENEFSGIDLGNFPNEVFHLGDVYGTGEADCGGVVSLGSNPNSGIATDAAISAETFRMSVYPNPVTDVLKIRMDADADVTDLKYTIVATNGATLLSGNEQELDVSSLPNGLYFITMKVDGKEVERQKFIKH